MRSLRSVFCVSVLALLVPVGIAEAQISPRDSGPAAVSSRLRVYIESCECFNEFLRTEITWVDFVRQPQDADLQILSSRVTTGAGGSERTLRFVGAGRFASVDHELRAIALPNESEDTERRAVLRVVQVGLLGFDARDGLMRGLDLRVQAPGVDTSAAPVNDRWNLWVFEVGANGSVQAEESSSEKSWELSIEADRVTAHWIVNVMAEIENESESFDLDDGRRVEASTREKGVDWFVAKSLGDHWSFGVDGEVESSTFGNVELSTQLMPAIEYNLFPYSDYASRQLRFEYAAGMVHARYNESTIYDRLRETRSRHRLSATLLQRQPWGSVESGVEWSQYLHDLGLNRLEFSGQVELRLVRGLALEIGGNASRIRDQISLPRRDATPEEVLLRLRELQSGYEVGFSIGVSYSFGSIFNNVVNPRFGRN